MRNFDLTLHKISRFMKIAAFLTLLSMVSLVMWCLLKEYPLDQANLAEVFTPFLVLMIAVSCCADLILATRRKDE